MPRKLEGKLLPGDASIAIVASRFNDFITDRLLDGAVDAWTRLGGDADALTIVHVPGSFELPVTARKLAKTGKYQAVVCLGCVIKGETDHYDHVVEQTAKGIRQVGTQVGIPCIFGVITCQNLEQAIHRAGAKMGNQGASAMLGAIEMANLMEKID